MGVDGAAAQSTPEFQRTYVNPFPSGDRYRVLVLGDSLGDGLWSGLYRTFQEDKNLEIVNQSKVSSGFVRVDYYDWNKALDDILKDNNYQMAVVMFGANDNQPIRQGKEYFKPGTDAWREAYGKRVETFIKKLRANKLAVYWAGLPIMRSPNQKRRCTIPQRCVPREGFHQRRQVCRHLERLHRRFRPLQRLWPGHGRSGQAAACR